MNVLQTDTLKHLDINGVTSLFSVSPMHGVECLRTLDEIISALDNLVFRLGFARTRRAARQLVNHGHITVNGKKVDIPSYLCSVGDKIAIKEGHNLIVVKESLSVNANRCAFATVDVDKLVGTFVRVPERNELPQDINEAQIIEYYNRLL